VDDLEITALVKRLSRPHASGGVVIERAAILAAGADFPAVMDWIIAHSGTPDATVPTTRRRGLHGARISDGDAAAAGKPARFVLPAEGLS
jgi:enterochelin esterase-like enzyme